MNAFSASALTFMLAVYCWIAWQRGWVQPVFAEVWSMRHPIRYARRLARRVR